MATKNVDEMSFLDHLEDLRWHLIRITIAVILAGIIAFCFPKILFGVIIFGPTDMHSQPINGYVKCHNL